jgi:hypothetical protein
MLLISIISFTFLSFENIKEVKRPKIGIFGSVIIISGLEAMMKNGSVKNKKRPYIIGEITGKYLKGIWIT